MDHPLLSDISSLTDEQIVEKINSLTQKWFQTRNPDAQHQKNAFRIFYFLDMHY